MRIATPAAAVVAACLLAPGLARADDATSPPLGGPPVAKDADTGKDGFGMEGGPRNRERPMQAMLADRRNGELWRRALESVLPTLPQEVQAQIREVRTDFDRRAKAWKEENGPKLKELESRMRPKRDAMPGDGGTDGKPAAAGPAPKPDPELVQELQRLRATAPKPEEAQAKVWALLTPEQQAQFKERYDALQAEAQKRRDEQRRGADAPKQPGPMEPDPMLPGGGKPGKRPGSGKPFNFEDGPADAGDAPKGK